MKVTRVEFVEVVVPARPGAINSPDMDRPLHKLPYRGRLAWSVQFDEIPKWIALVHCDDGTVGIGESLRGAQKTTLQAMAWSLIGADVATLPWTRLPLPRTREYELFECAIYDLAGKLAGLPVCQLLGGRYRDHVLVSAWSGHRTPRDAAERAKHAFDAGIHCIKFKCSLEDDVVEWARLIRDACGDAMRIILDPNERWEELRHATSIATELEKVGNVLCIEDPLPRGDLGAYAELRARTRIPVAFHVALGYAEHGQRIEDLVRAAQTRAADVFNFSGGIANFARLANGADLVGRPYWHGSEVDLGVLEAAYVHSAAAAVGCTLPSDVFGRRIREHDLLTDPLLRDGEHVAIPEGPGLGVEIDHEALAKYETERFEIGG